MTIWRRAPSTPTVESTAQRGALRNERTNSIAGEASGMKRPARGGGRRANGLVGLSSCGRGVGVDRAFVWWARRPAVSQRNLGSARTQISGLGIGDEHETSCCARRSCFWDGVADPDRVADAERSSRAGLAIEPIATGRASRETGHEKLEPLAGMAALVVAGLCPWRRRTDWPAAAEPSGGEQRAAGGRFVAAGAYSSSGTRTGHSDHT
jgi:hypothetical protein